MTTSRGAAGDGGGAAVEGLAAGGETLAIRLAGDAAWEAAPRGCAHAAPLVPAATVAAATQPVRNLDLTSSPALFFGSRGLNHPASNLMNVKLKKERFTMQNLLAHAFVGLTVALLPHASVPALAQAASFGCKVLLCAAASQPNWQGIAYCVPVMQELFAGIRKGRGWPTCGEANASAPGYEPYHPCPSGSSAGMIDAGRLLASSSGNVCARPRSNAPTCAGASDADCSLTDGFEITPRLQRAEPYFVDFGSGAGEGSARTRFWFNLQP